ncbi:MAG: hypothetical protein WAM79_03765 [Candidatus Sulfotelmatobacter sp.]
MADGGYSPLNGRKIDVYERGISMVNPTGNLTLNGITDAELVKILEVKMRHEANLGFNPQQMQVVNLPAQPGKQLQAYNSVILHWTTERGLEAVQEIVHFLLKKEEAAKAVGQ